MFNNKNKSLMELNRLVFPKPTSSYTHDSMKGKIIYIPKSENILNHLNLKLLENLNTSITLTNKFSYEASKLA